MSDIDVSSEVTYVAHTHVIWHILNSPNVLILLTNHAD